MNKVKTVVYLLHFVLIDICARNGALPYFLGDAVAFPWLKGRFHAPEADFVHQVAQCLDYKSGLLGIQKHKEFP